MCGIAGIVGPDAQRHVDAVRRMMLSMQHRGPDGDGLYISESNRCVFGFRRLALLDLTDAASQPMTFADGRFALAYNGECYNFQDLRRQFLEKGETFNSTGDTEVVLRLLVRDSHKALSKLNGMFAIAFWDDTTGQLLLGRDRYGQKPLYYAVVGDNVVFCSEIRSLLSSGLIPRAVNQEAVSSYLCYGCVQEPETIVQNVRLLPRGSYLRFGPALEAVSGAIEYDEVRGDCSPDELRELFVAAVKRHLISDAPIGLFLSGGLDSGSIAVAATRVSTGPIKSLSVTFPEYPEFSEGIEAQALAQYAGTVHHEVPISAATLSSLLPRALDSLDQPTIDGMNTYLVSHAAHSIGLKAALSGLGGDELFGGYPSFRDVPRALSIKRAGGPIFTWLVQAGLAVGPKRRQTEKLADLVAAPADPLSLYVARRRLFTTAELKNSTVAAIDVEPAVGLTRQRIQQVDRLIEKLPIADAISSLEIELYMSQMLLRDTDVMGMANNVEIRCPFLDNDFSSQAISLHNRIREQRNVPKWFFASAMEAWLPSGYTEKPKRGFELPYTRWLVGPLKDEVEGYLHNLAGSNWPVSKPYVLALWKSFLDNPQRVGWIRPWSLFVLARFLVKNTLSP